MGAVSGLLSCGSPVRVGLDAQSLLRHNKLQGAFPEAPFFLTSCHQYVTTSFEMTRFREPYTLLKRKTKAGKVVYYYRLADDPQRIQHSTGCRTIGDAKRFCDAKVQPRRANAEQTLRSYLDPYFVWETCPHVRRLVDEGKAIGRRHAHEQRRILELYIWEDAIAERPVRELTRGDLVDFRDRVRASKGPAVANKAVGALKTALQEGVYREELDRNPALKIGAVKYEKKIRGTFLPVELQALFPGDPPGPWPDLAAYTCFLLAWANGMRRGELYALRWRHLDLDARILRVDEAWKGGEEIGAPKWGHRREEALSAAAAVSLVALRADGIHTAPDDLVFGAEDGAMRSEQWWRDCFASAMATVKVGKDTGIDARARRLTPHAFRHTINTQLLNEGMDAEKVRAMLGWTNESTQKGYTHRTGADLREGAAAVDRILGRK